MGSGPLAGALPARGLAPAAAASDEAKKAAAEQQQRVQIEALTRTLEQQMASQAVLGLEVDNGLGGTAEAPKGELRTQFERHKEMLSASSIALEGALEAYKLDASLRAQQDGGGSADAGGSPPLAGA